MFLSCSSQANKVFLLMMVLPTRRFSFFDKLVDDGDIPLEELRNLGPSKTYGNESMNIVSQPPVSSGSYDMKPISPEFETEEYLAYRRRVFEQLADDYEKEPLTEDSKSTELSNGKNLQLHSSQNPPLDCSKSVSNNNSPLNDLQPSWDDSDLQSDTYISPEHCSGNIMIPGPIDMLHQNQNYLCKHQTKSHFMLENSSLNLGSWTSFDAKIKKASKTQLLDTSSNVFKPSSEMKARSGHTSSQKQKFDRESIRKKLSLPADNDEAFNNPEKHWQQRFDRSISLSNQSLQICYMNESCSSDENDNSSSVGRKASSETLLSSTALPYFTSPSSYGKGYLRQPYLSDASSPTSPTAISSDMVLSERINGEFKNYHELHPERSKCKQLEIEARYQLAKAHEKVKIEAEKDRKSRKLESSLSVVHHLLSFSVNQDTHEKIKNYNLRRIDCLPMTMRQIQLILNDMHTKKQGLNECLVLLLLERDELQTEQDAKLVDIDDMKAILNSLGPETTV